MAQTRYLPLALLLAFTGLAAGATTILAASGNALQEPTTTSLTVKETAADGQPLMPGSWHHEALSISTAVNSIYTFKLSLTARQPMAGLTVVIEDQLGQDLFDGPAAAAGFSGRQLLAGGIDRLTVLVGCPLDTNDVAPGAAITESWTVVAQPD